MSVERDKLMSIAYSPDMVKFLHKWVPTMEERLIGVNLETLDSAVQTRFPRGFWEGRERMGRDFFAFERLMFSVRSEICDQVGFVEDSLNEKQILIIRQATAKVWEEMRGEIVPLWWSWLPIDAKKVAQVVPAIVFGSAPELITDLRDIAVSAELTALVMEDKEVPNSIKDALRGVLSVNEIVDAQWLYSFDDEKAVSEAEFLVRRWGGMIAFMAHEHGLEKLLKLGFDPFVVSDVLVSKGIVRDLSWCKRNLGARLTEEVGFDRLSKSDSLYPIFWINIQQNAKLAEFLMRMEQVYLLSHEGIGTSELLVKAQGIPELALELRLHKLPTYQAGNGRVTSWQTALLSRMPRTAELLEYEELNRGIPDLLEYEFNALISARHPRFDLWVGMMEIVLEGGLYQLVKDGWTAEKRQVLVRYLHRWWMNLENLQGIDLNDSFAYEFEIACALEIGLICSEPLLDERHEKIADMVSGWEELIEIHGMSKTARLIRRMTRGSKAKKQEILGKVLWEQVMGDQAVGEDGWERWKKGLGDYALMARRKREIRSAL